MAFYIDFSAFVLLLAAVCFVHPPVTAEATRLDAVQFAKLSPSPMTSVKFPTQLFPEYDWMSAPTRMQQSYGCKNKDLVLKWHLAPSQCAQADEVPGGTSVTVQGLPEEIKLKNGKRIAGPNGQAAVVQHPGIIYEIGPLRFKYPVRLVESEDCRDCVIHLRRDKFKEVPHACCPLPGERKPSRPQECEQWLRCDSWDKFVESGESDENIRLAWSLIATDNVSSTQEDVDSDSRHEAGAESANDELVGASTASMSVDKAHISNTTAQHVGKDNVEDIADNVDIDAKIAGEGDNAVNVTVKVYRIVENTVEEATQLIDDMISNKESLVTHISEGICSLLNVGSYGCRLHEGQCECSYLAMQSCKTWFEDELEIRPVSTARGMILLTGDRCNCDTGPTKGKGKGQWKYLCNFGFLSEFPTIHASRRQAASA